MSKIRIYHNPRCSKSRQTLQLLIDNNIEPEIIEYLNTPLTPGTLKSLIKNLGIQPHDLLRTKEPEHIQANLSKESTQIEIINAIIQYPKLLERPIVTNGDQAAIGRPPENVLKII